MTLPRTPGTHGWCWRHRLLSPLECCYGILWEEAWDTVSIWSYPESPKQRHIQPNHVKLRKLLLDQPKFSLDQLAPVVRKDHCTEVFHKSWENNSPMRKGVGNTFSFLVANECHHPHFVKERHIASHSSRKIKFKNFTIYLFFSSYANCKVLKMEALTG